MEFSTPFAHNSGICSVADLARAFSSLNGEGFVETMGGKTIGRDRDESHHCFSLVDISP